ncbi:hypothetical protein JMJ77_0007573 [Colletotrichum scovillei]|uniref:Uncharacterized protein n=1 Tax=Colletotrichum scovillei TaxID=1209932 RepID=A0A9P7UL98_9PEZI|nr:hypothetical protein JMJ77_0007573 [Colletotrichum scovillei]KAG7074550.1 hypothetical protein JMJ76_0011027 [Colletotrichum scovillei]KAG7081514.1 hypothetical protein JMJ78_0003633 [Colletotrichum scovillei]
MLLSADPPPLSDLQDRCTMSFSHRRIDTCRRRALDWRLPVSGKASSALCSFILTLVRRV